MLNVLKEAMYYVQHTEEAEYAGQLRDLMYCVESILATGNNIF